MPSNSITSSKASGQSVSSGRSRQPGLGGDGPGDLYDGSLHLGVNEYDFIHRPHPETSNSASFSTGSYPSSSIDARSGSLRRQTAALNLPRSPACSFASSPLTHPIPQNLYFTSQPSTSPSAVLIRQTPSASTVSGLSATDIDTEVQSQIQNAPRQREESGTPDTSQTNSGEQQLPAYDEQNHAAAVTLTSAEILNGLSVPVGHLIPLSIPNPHNDQGEDILEQIVTNRWRNPQLPTRAEPWSSNAEVLRSLEDDDQDPLAPKTGFVYDRLYSSMRGYSHGERNSHKKRRIDTGEASNAQTQAESSRSSESSTPERRSRNRSRRRAALPPAFSSAYWETDFVVVPSRSASPQYELAISRGPSRPMRNSPQDLALLVHPDFLVGHLSRDAVVALTNELCASSLTGDHPINFNLGFGPLLPLLISTFKPRSSAALRSFRKTPHSKTLISEDSLPIGLDVCTLETDAGDINLWLDNLLDSREHLEDYADLFLRRQKGSHSAQVVEELVSWYLNYWSHSRSDEDKKAVRTAFKFHICTTVLGAVPSLTQESLTPLLPSLSLPETRPTTEISLKAPKLLTRQIKTSIFQVQHDLLLSLFETFQSLNSLSPEVKLAIALLVASVLEVVRKAGRAFAEHASTIHKGVKVEQFHVKGHEETVDKEVFGRVSTFGRVCESGNLVDKLRGLGKGKGNEEECGGFVGKILNSVFV